MEEEEEGDVEEEEEEEGDVEESGINAIDGRMDKLMGVWVSKLGRSTENMWPLSAEPWGVEAGGWKLGGGGRGTKQDGPKWDGEEKDLIYRQQRNVKLLMPKPSASGGAGERNDETS